MMRLIEVYNAYSKKDYCDKNKNLWKYIPVNQMDDKIDHKDIIGDIGCVSNKKSVAVLQSVEEDKEISVFPFSERLKYGQKVIGYISCRDEAGMRYYIRIVRRSVVKILLPILLLCLIAGGGLFLYMMQQGKPKLDEAAIAYQMPNGIKNEDPSQIMLPGFGTIQMESGSREIYAALANPEGNPCYFKYTVTLQETGETLYESGWLEPGTAVTEWEISETLEPGEYPIDIEVRTGSLDDYEEEMNKGAIEATLEVLE